VGRLSVRHPEDSWVVNLSWHHRLLTDDLLLSTALGGVVAKLFYDENQIIIEDSDGDRRVVNEDELTSQLGYSPPLHHLKYWARGMPNPNLTVQVAKSSPTQRAFKQDGWGVTLEQFSDIKGVALPTKISLLKNKLKIKLVVDKWLG
jgi:outer membrane lipoprotein LolB